MKEKDYFSRIGLITYPYFTEKQVLSEHHKLSVPLHKQLLEKMGRRQLKVFSAPSPIKSEADALSQGEKLLNKGIDLVIAYIPQFTRPSAIVRNALQLRVPFVLYGSLPGVIACGGSLHQVGHPHIRVYKDAGEKNISSNILSYSRAAFAKRKLINQIYGIFGGRSIGMYATVFDPNQVTELFGVDVEHIPQREIIRKAEKITKNRTDKYLRWLEDTCGGIVSNLNAEERNVILRASIASYLATKELVREYRLDFIGVKCQPPGTIHNYVTQCLAASSFPDPYDGEGEKEPFAYACEADGDAGLTMQILKLISGGKATIFADLQCRFPDGTFSIKNCGGMATYYAGRNSDPKKNMKNVYLAVQKLKIRENIVNYINVTYVAAPGEMTFARLYRDENRNYKMAIMKGEFVRRPGIKNKKGTYDYLQAFTRLEINDFDKMVNELGSHHILGVEGNHVEELKYICGLYKIETVFF